MGKYLLETTTCSHLMQNNPVVKRHLNALTDSDDLFTIPIVQGEILYGIERLPTGRKQRELLQRANNLFAEIQCDPIPKDTGIHYARLKRQAEKQGTPVAENDLWIAATALALDAILVTADSDFQKARGRVRLAVGRLDYLTKKLNAKGDVVQTTTVSQLKTSLRACLRQVKAGEEVIITEHGRPIARLLPIAHPRSSPEYLKDMEQKGLLKRGAKPLPADFWDLPRPAAPMQPCARLS